MEKTETTKMVQTVKKIGLFISSGLETAWAAGVAIFSGLLMA